MPADPPASGKDPVRTTPVPPAVTDIAPVRCETGETQTGTGWRCSRVRLPVDKFIPGGKFASVFAYFGSYGVVALDLEGQLLWERRLPHPGYGFGVGSSPILAGDNLILARDGAPEQAILWTPPAGRTPR